MTSLECSQCSWLPMNAVMSFVAAIWLTILALHPRVRPRLGMLIWFGVVVAACTLVLTGYVLLADPDNRLALNRSGAMLRLSLSVICFGIFLKAYHSGKRKREELDGYYGEARTRGLLNTMMAPARDLGDLFDSDHAPLPTRLGQSNRKEKQ